MPFQLARKSIFARRPCARRRASRHEDLSSRSGRLPSPYYPARLTFVPQLLSSVVSPAFVSTHHCAQPSGAAPAGAAPQPSIRRRQPPTGASLRGFSLLVMPRDRASCCALPAFYPHTSRRVTPTPHTAPTSAHAALSVVQRRPTVQRTNSSHRLTSHCTRRCGTSTRFPYALHEVTIAVLGSHCRNMGTRRHAKPQLT